MSFEVDYEASDPCGIDAEVHSLFEDGDSIVAEIHGADEGEGTGGDALGVE